MTPWLGRGTTTVHGRIDAIKGMNEFPPRASGPRRPSAVVSRERRVVSPTSALPHGPECREGPRPARALCATPPAVDAHTDSDTPRTRDCGLTVRNILSVFRLNRVQSGTRRRLGEREESGTYCTHYDRVREAES